MDGEAQTSHGRTGQGPGEMGELIDTPPGAEKLKGMRSAAARGRRHPGLHKWLMMMVIIWWMMVNWLVVNGGTFFEFSH